MKRFAIITTVVAVVFVAGSIVLLGHFESPVPVAIKQQAGFPLAVASGDWRVEAQSFSYEKTSKVVGYVARRGDVSVNVNQQPVPDLVAENQYLDALLGRLQEYDSVATGMGKVHLTHPKELKGGQSAVLRTDTLLLFARPNHDLSNLQWQDLFNSLKLVK